MSRNNNYRKKRTPSKRGGGITHKRRNNIMFLVVLLIIIAAILYLLIRFDVINIDSSRNKGVDDAELVATIAPTEKIEATATIAPITPSPSPMVTPTPEPTMQTIGYVNTEDVDGSVRVRVSSSSDSEVLGSVYNRETLYLLGWQDGFYNIRFEGNSAFVYAPYVLEGLPPDNKLRDIITGDIQESIFVNLQDVIPDIRIEQPFVTADNFAETQLYPFELALMQADSALKLKKAQELFIADGYSIVVWDVYRPYSVSKEIFDIFKNPKLVADPKLGSKHNRGVAVDMTLYNLTTNEYVDMPTESRLMNASKVSRRSNRMSSTQRKNMKYMTEIMEKAGFVPYTGEWWHYNDEDWEDYPVVNIQFEAWQ